MALRWGLGEMTAKPERRDEFPQAAYFVHWRSKRKEGGPSSLLRWRIILGIRSVAVTPRSAVLFPDLSERDGVYSTLSTGMRIEITPGFHADISIDKS